MPTTTINLTGQALSKTDDTNVTLTLGGTPLTALLKATSLTLGWTGTLAATRGGTGLGALGTANQLLRVNGAGTALEYFTPSFGTGTVTSVSVVSANGFAGTVANATTTPAITISTSISGLLKGNGTAISAAVAGTDYLTPTGSGAGLSGVVITVNGASGAITNIGVTTNPLSQFAATTSAQLAGVISDETGSGALVFGTSPTFTTDISAPKIISSTASAGLLLCNNNGVTVASFGVGSAGSTNIGLIGATAVTGTISGTSSLTLGTASSVVGSIVLQNATNANTLTIQSGATSASYSLTLPTAQGGANTYLKNDGSGNLSWATVASGISIGDAIGNSPVTGSVLMVIGTTLTQSISYRAQQATPFGTAFGFASMAGNTGVNNTAFGYNAGLGQTTGTDNLYLGYNAGFRNITGNRNIYLGGITGDVALTNLSDNIFIGVGAGVHCSGGSNIVIGSADSGSNLGGQNTVVGYRAFWNASGSPTYNAALGFFAGYSASGHGSVYLGALAGYASTYTRAIGIGNQAQPSQNNEMMIGGVDSWFGGTGATVGITNVCIGNGNTYSSPASVTMRITSASGSNIAGGTFTLAGSKATGTGAGGDIKHQTSVKGSSGTTVQTLGDRFSIVGKYVDLTAATATAFCRINIPTSTTAGGFVIATVEANDGTDFQARTFYISWAAANKAGTTTVGLDVPHEIVAATSGTLTGTMTLVDSGSGNIDFKMDASSSLAETTLRISFQVFKNFGTGAVSAS